MLNVYHQTSSAKGGIDLTKNPKKRGDGKLLKGRGDSVGKGGCY